VAEERLKLAILVDFDNIQIGVKDTLRRDFDVSIVLEALKERGEVVTKVAYADWHRAGEQSRQMTEHAVQMVQRNFTPRGDKNAADINLALDALEMAFNRPHINAFAIVSGDSDYIPLVEKLKQYGKRVIVVGGRGFTSNILQRNCHEFIAYENLLKSGTATDASRGARATRRGEAAGRGLETRPVSEALPGVQRALKILAEREVAPQLGVLKSTLLQLDATFSERDYGASSFLDFIQKMEREKLVRLGRTERGYLVGFIEGEAGQTSAEPQTAEEPGALAPTAPADTAAAMDILKPAVAAAAEKAPHRPLYMRQIRQALRSVVKDFDERRYGFRGILDLLYHAQREGIVRLQRDRKGVLRIFPISGTLPSPAFSAPTSVAGTEAASPITTESAPPEASITESIPQPQPVELPEPEAARETSLEEQAPALSQEELAEVAPSVVEQAAAEEAQPQRRGRRPRSAKSLAKSSSRASSGRHKTKVPSQD